MGNMIEFKQILGLLPVLISAGTLLIYLKSVYFGKTRPHLFTWLIWGLVGAIAAAGQYVEGAGSGMWLTAAISVFAFIRCIAALTHGEKGVTMAVWLCLLACLAAVIVWPLVNNPFWSVLMVTLIDLVAFVPTWRKSWNKPGEEHAGSYVLFGFTALLSIIAMENYNATTVLYPLSILLSCWAFVGMLMIRRKALGYKNHIYSKR